jgi:hypothetical protein
MGTLVSPRRLLALLLVLGGCNPAGRHSTPPPATSTGGAPASGGSTGGSSGTGGAVSSPPDLGAPTGGVAADASGPVGGMSVPDSAADMSIGPRDGGGGDGYPDSDFLPGRPDIRLCKKDWTPEQCCAFLCGCLDTICGDSAKAKPGLGTCMSWCPKLGDMARRCHVYHCYISISPTGGINDHDSHCGHAANEVQGGGCPTEVYQ